MIGRLLQRFFLSLADGVLQLTGVALFLFYLAAADQLNDRGLTVLLSVGGAWLLLMLIVRGIRQEVGGR